MIGTADAVYLRERLDIFQDMPPAQLERWSQRMVERSYAAGAAGGDDSVEPSASLV